ncbi:hypothetical protein MMC28_011034 [Mycoblastus sanguinarius]|nr:hypothetical protein [Mycoblastus sanguinarius]
MANKKNTSKKPAGETSAPLEERRTTSSARQPRPGLPLPRRVQVRSNAGETSFDEAPPKREWHAQVECVSKGDRADYSRNRAVPPVFAYDAAKPSNRCILKCKGNVQRLEMEISWSKKHQDPEPEVILHIVIPQDEDLFDLRFFESTRSLELRWTSKSHPFTGDEHVESESPVWFVYFRTEGKLLDKTKVMIKRLQNVMSEMPDAWFTYRNFFALRPTSDKEDLDPETAPTTLDQEISGGHTWKSTGFLASLEFQRAIGRIRGEAVTSEGSRAPALASTSMVMRARAEVEGTELVELSGKNKVKAQKKAQKQQRRRQKRQKELESSLAVIPETADVSKSPDLDITSELQPEGGLEEQSIGDRQSAEPGVATMTDRPSPSASQEEWEIERFLDVRVEEEQTQYLVQWTVGGEPTWEPANNIPPASIEEFYTNRVVAQQQSDRGRSGRGGRRGGRVGRR